MAPRFLLSFMLLVLAVSCPGTSAFAHAQEGVAGGFASGFSHPLTGPDHLIAMVAVGLWGAQLGQPLIWILPMTFPLVMAFGGLLALIGVPMPFVAWGVPISAIVLGLMVALHVRPPVWLAALLVAAFAIFHGHAHGGEVPDAANPLAYSIGFVLATGLLHLAGILVGLAVAWPMGVRAVRACGVVIAVLGGYFLAAQMGMVGA
jgi:urease accessory protein